MSIHSLFRFHSLKTYLSTSFWILNHPSQSTCFSGAKPHDLDSHLKLSQDHAEGSTRDYTRLINELFLGAMGIRRWADSHSDKVLTWPFETQSALQFRLNTETAAEKMYVLLQMTLNDSPLDSAVRRHSAEHAVNIVDTSLIVSFPSCCCCHSVLLTRRPSHGSFCLWYLISEWLFLSELAGNRSHHFMPEIFFSFQTKELKMGYKLAKHHLPYQSFPNIRLCVLGLTAGFCISIKEGINAWRCFFNQSLSWLEDIPSTQVSLHQHGFSQILLNREHQCNTSCPANIKQSNATLDYLNSLVFWACLNLFQLNLSGLKASIISAVIVARYLQMYCTLVRVNISTSIQHLNICWVLSEGMGKISTIDETVKNYSMCGFDFNC